MSQFFFDTYINKVGLEALNVETAERNALVHGLKKS